MTTGQPLSSSSTAPPPVVTPAMPPRRALFITLLVAWGLWILALLFMYFTTVYPSATTH